MIHQRVRTICIGDHKGMCVVYNMSRDQRVRDNHALVSAQDYAVQNNLPLIVFFNINSKISVRLKQHYTFMIEGLKQIESQLDKLRIHFVVKAGFINQNIQWLHSRHKIEALFFDFSPFKETQRARLEVSRMNSFSCYEVDTHNIVPVWVTSQKQEYSARTIRGKIESHIDTFLEEPKRPIIHPFQLTINNCNDWESLANTVTAEKADGYNPNFSPGEKSALQALEQFMNNKLQQYASKRNDPSTDGLSNLSPYIHFGMISSLRIVLDCHKYIQADASPEIQESINVLKEEIITRKELSDNFCYYNQEYDNIKGAPQWALNTLEKHRSDIRERIYTLEELETAQTADDAWNASQMQMIKSGKMHGYMRMYWAKKILEWTEDPETAISYAQYLNDKYELDGYDPNGYVGILWSIAGLHDRPWPERPIFGTVRYMNRNGLQRKFDVEKYVKAWSM